MMWESVLTKLISRRTLKTSSIIVITIAMIFISPFMGGCANDKSKEQKKGKTMSILQKQPEFLLNISVSGVGNFINVNGVTVDDASSQTNKTFTLPINLWMRSGENTIGVNVLPSKRGEPFNPNSYVKLALMVRELNDPGHVYTIAKLYFSGTMDDQKSYTHGSSPTGILSSINGFKQDVNGDVQIFNVVESPRKTFAGAMNIERKINIPNSLPLWAFFESEEMPDYHLLNPDRDKYDKDIEPLYRVYRKVYEAIANKDIESILPMFDERNRETDQAFYLEPGTTAAGMKKALLETINEKDLQLVAMDIRHLGFILEDNRRLTSLRRRGMDDAVVLNYINEKKGIGSESFPMFFRYQNGKYILTR